MAYQPKNMKKKKKNRGIAWALNLFSVLFGCMILVACAMILYNAFQSRSDQNAFRELAAMVETRPEPVQTVPGKEEIPEETATEPAKTQYHVLYEQNQDFAGWLTVPGTAIDYPVMHTPEEIEHYIYRAFDGSDSPSGTPFVGDYGSLDSQRCIIFGHNMRDGSMFHDVLKYMSEDFWRENPSFTITTPTEHREYEIFAAVQTRLLYPEEQGLRFYHLEDGVEEWMIQRSRYDTGIVPQEGDEIVILSTCSYHTADGRFIIAGRRVADADQTGI